MKRLSSFFITMLSIILCFTGYSLENDAIISIAILCITLLMVINYYGFMAEHIVFFGFIGMVFYFMALTPICMSLGIIDYHYSILYVDSYLNLILTVIYISLLSIFLSYSFWDKANIHFTFGRSISKKKLSVDRSNYYSRIFQLVLPFFVVSAAAKMYIAIIKLLFSSVVSYVTYHAEVQYVVDSVPSLIIRLASTYDILFCMALATFQNIKKVKWFFIFDLGISGVLLLTGLRTYFAKSLLVFVIYLIYYYAYNDDTDRTRVIKKIYIMCFLALPGFIVASTVLQYYRAQIVLVDKSFFQLLSDGLIGNESAQMIAHVEKFKFILPRTGFYSLGDIRLWFNNSILGRIMDLPFLYSHTVEMAQAGVALGQTVAYYVMPDNYLYGGAFGSSYVAELYADGGYIGVALGSFLYGSLLSFIKTLPQKSYGKRVIAFLMISVIVYSPRAGFSSVITNVFSIINIIVALGIYLLIRRNKVT